MADLKISALPLPGTLDDADEIIVNDGGGSSAVTSKTSLQGLKNFVLGSTPAEGGLAGAPIMLQFPAHPLSGKVQFPYGWKDAPGKDSSEKIPNFYPAATRSVTLPDNTYGVMIVYLLNVVCSTNDSHPFWDAGDRDTKQHFRAFMDFSFNIPGGQFLVQNSTISDPLIKATTNGVSIRTQFTSVLPTMKSKWKWLSDASNLTKFTFWVFDEGASQKTIDITLQGDLMYAGQSAVNISPPRFAVMPYTKAEALAAGFAAGNIEEEQEEWGGGVGAPDLDDDVYAKTARSYMNDVQNYIEGALQENSRGNLSLTTSEIDALKRIKRDVYLIRGATGNSDGVTPYNIMVPFSDSSFGEYLFADENTAGQYPTIDTDEEAWKAARAAYNKSVETIGFKWSFETTRALN